VQNLTIRNISGIRSGSTTIDDGLNVVQASNFRGKSSLIASLRTIIGATGQYDDHPLTEGTDQGEVTLSTDSEEFNLMLERTSQSVINRKGTPYLSDETDQICARLFACLDKNNPIRKAVRSGGDLTEILQAPLNIEDIDAQIAELKGKKNNIEQQISQAQQAGEQLPSVQETVTGLEAELKQLQERRADLTKEESNKDRIEELSNEISTKSSQLTNITQDISRIESEIELKTDQISQKEDEIADFDIPDEIDTSRDIDAMQEQVDTLNRQIDLIEDLYRANQNVIDADEVDIITDVDRSIAADEVKCWVCDQQTTRDKMEKSISQLQSKIADLREKKEGLQNELEKIEARKQEVRRGRQKKERLQNDVQQLKADIDEKKGILQDKQERKEELEEEITALREELQEAEDEYNEELTDVKTEIRTTETKLQDKRENLKSLEAQYKKLEDLQDQQEEIRSEITELRNQKKNTQQNLKDRFNSIISDIIEEFQPGFSSARLVLKTDQRGEVEAIELKIARDIDNVGQRTSVNTLSEGEVELIGLVVALAGYHAFNVESKVPYILIDGISQLAAEHLRSVATYLDGMSEVLVTTAYPEAGNFDGHVIDPDEWDVVSDQPVITS
jgi:DNA repair exonuclease SbcCD ATPase subunit